MYRLAVMDFLLFVLLGSVTDWLRGQVHKLVSVRVNHRIWMQTSDDVKKKHSVGLHLDINA